MQISHAEAHKLIQQSVDASLPREKEITLSAHLQTCPECIAYRDEIRGVEEALRSTMRRHWNFTPVPLDMNALTGKIRFNAQGRWVTQLATISLTVILAAFGAWRLINVNAVPTETTPPQISPIPTPSTQMTSTRFLPPNCKEIVYTVEQGQTLESIAELFSTSIESIMELNKLESGMVQTGNTIKIPICFTPSATTRPAVFTVTCSPAPLTTSEP